MLLQYAIYHNKADQLVISQAGDEKSVSLIQCFPWSHPYGYLSLRDDKGREVVLIPDVSHLSAASQRAVTRELHDTMFVLEITEICKIEKEFELRNWEVLTQQGPRTFQTGLEDWPTLLPMNRLLIRDIGGDLYHIHDTTKLDEKSKAQLKGFVD